MPAPFSHARLAVPPSVNDAPGLSVILDATEVETLKRHKETMLRDEEEVRMLDELQGEVRVHVDPVLLRHRRVYIQLLRTLLGCGILRLSPGASWTLGGTARRAWLKGAGTAWAPGSL